MAAGPTGAVDPVEEAAPPRAKQEPPPAPSAPASPTASPSPPALPSPLPPGAETTTFVLEGEVVDEEGRPLPGALLQFWPYPEQAGRPLVHLQDSDAQGRFRLQLPAGDYRLRGEAEGFHGAWWGGDDRQGASPILLPRPPDASPIRLMLRRQAGVEPSPTPTEEPSPAPAASVTPFPTEEPDPTPAPPLAIATGAEGQRETSGTVLSGWQARSDRGWRSDGS